MKTTKKSRAEIQRAYHQRLLERNAEEARAKECKRWHARRNLKKVKVEEDILEREKRTCQRTARRSLLMVAMRRAVRWQVLR